MPLKINPATCNLDLVLSPGGGVAAITFAGDSGTATPTVAGLITMTGGTGVTTSATGNAVTFNIDSPVTVANGGTGTTSLTDGGILIGSGTGAVTVLGQATNGQLVIGSTGTDPVLSTLTAGTGMTVTNAAGSITLSSSGSAALSFPTDSGTATPAANALTIAGGTGLSTSGSGSTVTVNASAATILSVPTDSGTATPAANALTVTGGTGINTSGTGAAVTINIDTPVTVPNGGTAATSLTGVVIGNGASAMTATAITEHAVVIGSSSSDITEVGPLTNGQLVIGSTGVAPVAATLTAGTDITITEGAGTITISSTATGGSWVEETTTSRALTVNQNVIGNNAATITMTLPDSAALGDMIRIATIGAGSVKVAQNASEIIHFGTSTTTTGVGGSIESTEVNDAVELLCVVANLEWQVLSSQGNWTIV